MQHDLAPMHDQVPSGAIELAGFVLMHCAMIADSHRDGELICPFAVFEDEADQRIVAFESETQEESFAKGWASLEDARAEKEWWALGREGLHRTESGVVDVLLVSAWIPEMDAPVCIMQRFSRGPEEELCLIGEPELLVHVDKGGKAVAPVSGLDLSPLMRGIQLHPKGNRWAAWRPH